MEKTNFDRIKNGLLTVMGSCFRERPFTGNKKKKKHFELITSICDIVNVYTNPQALT